MKILKKVLLFVVEIAAATAIWCLLDYFFAEEINVAENVIGVTVIIVFTQIADWIAKKLKSKKDNK